MGMNVDFTDKKVQQITGIILIGIIVSGLLYWFQIKDNVTTLKSETEKRDTKRTELNRVRNLSSKLELLRDAVSKLRVELDELEGKFPTSANTPSLMSSITKMAYDNKLHVINFKPLPDVTKEYYVEHSYEIQLIGPYHKLGRFFQELADFELIVNVDKVTLKPSSLMSKNIADYRMLDMGDRKYDDRVNSVDTKFKISTYSSVAVNSNDGEE